MDNITIHQSDKTPLVKFDFADGKLVLRGRSMPEDHEAFFAPLNDWVKTYSKAPKPVTKVEMALEYFNTGSCVHLVAFFQILEELHNNNRSEVVVNWYYEDYDVDMKETGEEFKALFTLPITTVAVDSFDNL